MFIKETKETTQHERKSKFGKLVKYKRTKTIIHCECDKCNKPFTKIRNGKYNKESKTFCRDCISYHGLGKLLNEASYEAKTNNNFIPRIGQEIIARDGYPETYIGKNYPYREGGYKSIRTHTYVMECHLKRRLTKNEVVHHIDGDKTNNELSNLFLTTVAEHNKLHAQSEQIVFELVKKGIVKFNTETARYELVNI